MVERSSTRGRLGALVSIAALAWVASALSCSSGPVRVEWGFEKDTGDAPGDPDRPPAELSLSSQWAAWESLHDQLVRLIESRTYGEPVPVGIIPDCRLALEPLEPQYPEAVAEFQALKSEYDELATAPRLGSISAHVRRLERLGREVERIREP